MIRSMELILGHAARSGCSTRSPRRCTTPSAPTPANAEPYTAFPEQVDLLARNANTAANRALSAGLDLNHGVDRIPQRTLDAVLWKSVHGAAATPPPPGPNADPEKPNAESGDD